MSNWIEYWLIFLTIWIFLAANEHSKLSNRLAYKIEELEKRIDDLESGKQEPPDDYDFSRDD